MKRYLATAAVMVAFGCGPAHAAEPPAGVGTIGTGTFSCTKFSKYDGQSNNAGQMDLVVQWAWGFMSAYNARAAFAPEFQEQDAPNPVAPPDSAKLLGYIRQHCKENPTSNVIDATLDLITTLGGIVTSSVNLPPG